MHGAIWFLIIIIGGLLCGLGAWGGIMIERRKLTLVIREQAARNSEQERRLSDINDGLQNELKKMVENNEHLSSFLVILPDVVRNLNAQVSKRSIPPLLMKCLEQFFEPEQILVLTARSRNELVLAAGKGLPKGIEPGFIVPHGRGLIGMAAVHQIAKDREELLSEALQRMGQVAVDPEGFVVDLLAPIVYQGATLGVISVGGIGRRLRDQKRMIKLVADIGSLALSNVDNRTRLEMMANRDSLTSLGTKRYLTLKLAELLFRAQETHATLSVAIFDIDHFKKLNDTYGHLAGDQVLKAVSRILRSQLRTEDVPARYGGEEFVVVLPETTKEQALAMAEKVRRAIEAHSFPEVFGNGMAGGVTISGGVASCDTDGRNSNELLSAADQALYLAKGQGRNRVLAFRGRYLSDDTEDQEALTY